MLPAGRARFDDGAGCLEPWTPAVEATGESVMAWLTSGWTAGERAAATLRSVSSRWLGKPWTTTVEAGVTLTKGL